MADWMTGMVERMGYWGVALLMLLENIVPPIPSEVVMPSAGFTARQGEGLLWGYILAGTVGSLLGTLPFYVVGRWLGQERLYRFAANRGKWLGVSVSDLNRSMRWFERWGAGAVLLGRLVPGVRTLISLPAGFAGMNFPLFLACTTVGTVAWNTLLASLGWYLQSRYDAVRPYISWIGTAVVTGLVLWLAYRIWRKRSERDSGEASAAAESAPESGTDSAG